MRAVAVVLAGSLIASGCAVNSYQIPSSELERLAQVPPEARGQRVRVVQEIMASEVPAAPPVTAESQVVIVPQVEVSVGVGGRHRTSGFGGPKIGGAGNDSKASAIAFLVLAATAAITAAVVEGTRFDGFARLHPMHPVHLIGHDGSYAVVPLAGLDPNAVAWADAAVVRPNEGPWLELERAPLSRQGLTYGMYGGLGSLRSANGDLATGPAWTVQLGYFPTQEIGVLGSVFFGWRNNNLDATLFETRYTAELQFLPVRLGILHGGVFGGAGLAYRFEDAVKLSGNQVVTGDRSGAALVGGAMLQLELTTRLALTARLGISRAHGEEMHDAILGISVY